MAGILGVACQQAPSPPNTATLVFKNARIYTVDASRPWAEAVAIKEGRILEVGNNDDIAPLVGPDTKVVDLEGKLVLPAFGDGHMHPGLGGRMLAQCALNDGESVEEYLEIIAACVAETPAPGLIYGRGWLPGLFPPDGVPRKEALDAIAPDRPVIIHSTGGHSLWVNSAALEMAGITKDTPDPPNGRINRDPETGEPVGGLQEAAKELVLVHVPPPSVEEVKKALIYTADHMNALGITQWLDAGIGLLPVPPGEELAAYKGARDQGELTVHAALTILWDNDRGLEQIPDLLETVQQARALGLQADCIKFLLDGVIAQYTSALLEPYSDDPQETGTMQIPLDVFFEAVREFNAHGLQVHVHAIGDRAARTTLDALAAAREHNGDMDTRDVITHLNMVAPADQPRLAELGVMANFQPLWAAWSSYMDLTESRIGPERMTYHYPAHSILDAGAKIFYGSDWPVASANPLDGLEVAVTRRHYLEENDKPLLEHEAVTLEQAIEAYTLNVAYMNHREKDAGSITPGKVADLVVLDQDIFTIPVHDISKTKVLLTTFAGKVVFEDMPEL